MKKLLGGLGLFGLGAYLGGALATYWADQKWDREMVKMSGRWADSVTRDMHIGIDPLA